MNANAKAQIEWQAAQGNKNAQRVYADMLEAEGKLDWAEFYRAKANGHPAFTLANYQASKK